MTESHEDVSLDRQKLDLRCRMLEIERDGAAWQSEQYLKLLQQFGGGVGHAIAAEPQGRQQPVASSSRSAPATPSGPSQRRRPRPSLVARQDDDGRERHQWSVLLQYYVFG